MAKKGGKYAAILPGLPKLDWFAQEEQPGFQQKVEQEKRRILNEEPRQGSHFAKRVADLRRRKDELDVLWKANNLLLEAYKQLLIDQLENEGVSTIKLDDGVAITVLSEPHAVMKDKAAIRRWAMENGHENDLQFMWQTLNSIVKDLLKDGESLPPGVEVFSKNKIRVGGL